MTIINLTGRLGKDVEAKEVNGKTVRSLSLAVNQKTKDGDVTTWYRTSAWGSIYDKVSEYWLKGTVLSVTGVLLPPKAYIDNNGQARPQLDIKALLISFVPGSVKDKEQPSQPMAQGQGKIQAFNPNPTMQEEELPF